MRVIYEAVLYGDNEPGGSEAFATRDLAIEYITKRLNYAYFCPEMNAYYNRPLEEIDSLYDEECFCVEKQFLVETFDEIKYIPWLQNSRYYSKEQYLENKQIIDEAYASLSEQDRAVMPPLPQVQPPEITVLLQDVKNLIL